jgi:hypothetical protein
MEVGGGHGSFDATQPASAPSPGGPVLPTAPHAAADRSNRSTTPTIRAMELGASSLFDLAALAALAGLLTVAGWLAVGTLVLWSLRRHNRVAAAKVVTPAPLHWLVSPGWAARLHRRLRQSARLARHAAERRPASPVAELADDLVRQAVVVDVEVMAAARLPAGARWAALTTLSQRTATVSATATRLAGLAARQASGPDPAADLAQLDQRLDLLIQAHAELDHLDRTRGLAAT